VGLLHRIREQQSVLAALVDPENNLAGDPLPILWTVEGLSEGGPRACLV